MRVFVAIIGPVGARTEARRAGNKKERVPGGAHSHKTVRITSARYEMSNKGQWEYSEELR
jgi:hypothetical protein